MECSIVWFACQTSWFDKCSKLVIRQFLILIDHIFWSICKIDLGSDNIGFTLCYELLFWFAFWQMWDLYWLHEKQNPEALHSSAILHFSSWVVCHVDKLIFLVVELHTKSLVIIKYLNLQVPLTECMPLEIYKSEAIINKYLKWTQ